MPSKHSRRRKVLWDQCGGRCCWCGVVTVLPTPMADNEPKVPNLATIEHLRSKTKRSRYKPNDGHTPRTALACITCNVIRSQLEGRAFFPNLKIVIRG